MNKNRVAKLERRAQVRSSQPVITPESEIYERLLERIEKTKAQPAQPVTADDIACLRDQVQQWREAREPGAGVLVKILRRMEHEQSQIQN